MLHLVHLPFRGRLDCKKATDDHHGQTTGDPEERLQQLSETCPPRPGAAIIRDRPGYAGCAGGVDYYPLKAIPLVS